jgi:aminoglycoside phosphotransferase family enzyme/predicted kinase
MVVGSGAEVLETHISTLFFVDDLVLKRKRPITTGFVDFSTPEQRRVAGEREVELNRRLAPDVYLGVADLEMDGRSLDHVVVMRRLPPARRLSALLDDPSIADELHRVAHRVAAFHAEATRGPEIDRDARRDHLEMLWNSGLDQLAELPGCPIEPEEIERARTLALEYLRGRAPLIDARIDAGRACDGHGDLSAEDIFCLDDGPRILDCLEFDDSLRHGDVLLDLAFLAMDLERLGHRELARRFLDEVRELSGDNWPDSLAHHFTAYRAHIRSKVAALRVSQGDVEAAPLARRLHQIALQHLEAGRVRMILVGGSPGTGKSVLARGLGVRLDATVLSTDEIRDQLLPRGERDGADELHAGRYAPERVRAVYAELLRRARTSLGLGESVVLDASWLDPSRRREARTFATSTSSTIVELRAMCPPETVRTRLARRAAEGTDASEATEQIAAQIDADASPWNHATPIDTDAAIKDVVGAAERVVLGTAVTRDPEAGR